MADEQNTGLGETRPNGEGSSTAANSTGESGSSPAVEERNRQLQELTQAYERAREELNEAVRNVRIELSKIDFDQARTRAKSWVDENPTLAVFLGIGAGILTGRLLSGAFTPEPPPLSVRARKRAEILAREGGEYAGELSSLIAHQVARAVHEAGETGAAAAKRGGEAAERFGREARSLGDDVSRRAEKVGKDFSKRAERAGRDVSKRAERVGRDVSHRARDVGGTVTRRAEDVSEAISESAKKSFHELEDAAHDLSKTMKKRSKSAKKSVDRGVDFSGTVLNAARTAVAAVVIKKVNDWMKAMR